ncbi:MAG: SusC/RagA family TonB-linked outer membrane protein [Urechidicola sp.]|nr:SusC/RagA family TonB-linked outer membrane protein [Urechidicola sp.]
MRKKITLSFLAFFTTITFLFAQDLTVSGTVSDADGAVLPGVSIQVKGTNTGTSSDFDGNYEINASQGDVLVFSFLGFKNQEITVTGTTHDITLEEDATQLDEVVVTAFGITKSTKELGYSVTQVKTEDLNMSGQVSAVGALQGRVAGLRIQNTSGSAAGGIDILIRGMTSVNPGRSNQPLIIVDGIAIDNQTTGGSELLPSAGSNAVDGSIGQFGFSNRAGDINPEDIETYNVLKGAAATALYGVRAANGAIVITTKKGKLGKPKINLTVSSTFRNIEKTPELQKTFREGHRTSKRPGAIINDDADDGYDDYGFAFYSWGVPFTDDSFTQSDGTVVDLTNDRFYSPYDLFETGVNTQVNFNLSGANEKLDYFFSVGSNKDSGVMPNTNYDKLNFRFKGGYQITDNLSLNTSVSYTNSSGSRTNGGDKSVFSSLSYWSSTYPINDYQLPDGTQKNYSKGIIDNPRYFLETSNLQNKLNRWIANMSVNWNPKEWVNVVYSAQVDNYSDVRNRFVPPDLDTGTQVGGFVVNDNINYTGLESNLLVTFTKDFGEDFTSSLLVGHSVQDRKRNYMYVRGEGLNIPGINDVSNTSNIFGNATETRLRDVGLFGELKVGYKNKLFLSVTGRNDWTSVLVDSDSNSFFYPSISGSYVFHDLIPENDILTFGKVRASYAEVGKGPNFGELGRYFIPDQNFPFDGTGGYRLSTREGDSDIIPERVGSFEIGTDLRFLNDRVRVDYAYYKSKTSDQIFAAGTAFSSGLSSYVSNTGDFETWGHELLISGDVIKTENFKWESIVNFTTMDGKITKLPGDTEEIVFFGDRITAKSKVGDPLGQLYGWVFQTVPSGERYVGSDGKWVVTGSDNSGFYYTGTNEMVKVGNALADFIVSFEQVLTYKNFNLNFLIEWKEGGDIYDRGFRNALRNGNLKETEFRDQERVLDGMMDDGNGGFTANTQPLMITANSYYRDFNNYNSASEVLLQDASWVKLRNIGLTYNFTGNVLDKLGMDNLSLFGSASNIILWTPFKGFDPESNSFSAGSNIYGYTGLNVPLSVSYSFGVKVGF